MSHATTSLAPAAGPLPEWGRLWRFVAGPKLPDATAPFSEAVLRLAQLYVIDAALMIALGIVASAVLLMGVEFPENTLEAVPLTPVWIAIVVIGAPLTEEILFRSWLSGRPGYCIAGLLAVAVLFLFPFFPLGEGAAAGAIRGIVLAVALVLAVAALWFWRAHPPMGWFKRLFPVIFWLVTLVFALVHLINYEAASLAILLPLVIPQFVAGTLFGYARVQFGLWAAFVLHALHNGSAVAAMLLAKAIMPEAA